MVGFLTLPNNHQSDHKWSYLLLNSISGNFYCTNNCALKLRGLPNGGKVALVKMLNLCNLASPDTGHIGAERKSSESWHVCYFRNRLWFEQGFQVQQFVIHLVLERVSYCDQIGNVFGQKNFVRWSFMVRDTHSEHSHQSCLNRFGFSDSIP